MAPEPLTDLEFERLSEALECFDDSQLSHPHGDSDMGFRFNKRVKSDSRTANEPVPERPEATR